MQPILTFEANRFGVAEATLAAGVIAVKRPARMRTAIPSPLESHISDDRLYGLHGFVRFRGLRNESYRLYAPRATSERRGDLSEDDPSVRGADESFQSPDEQRDSNDAPRDESDA